MHIAADFFQSEKHRGERSVKCGRDGRSGSDRYK
jgi:hypothetical protein